MTGKELQELRKLNGFTQRGLAEELGYKGRPGECTVQNWEYDKQPIPMKHFRKLSELLRVPIERFIP